MNGEFVLKDWNLFPGELGVNGIEWGNPLEWEIYDGIYNVIKKMGRLAAVFES